MIRYLAFLRGINVGGHRKIKMADLRTAIVGLGLSDVVTYIQSGNVIFRSEDIEPADLEHSIEDRIQEAFGFDVPVMVRTADEVIAVVGAEPFGPAASHADATVYIGFLRQPAVADGIEALLNYQSPIYRVRVAGKHVFWLHRRDLGKSAATLGRVEKTLGTAVTFRNQATLRKLIAKYLV